MTLSQRLAQFTLRVAQWTRNPRLSRATWIGGLAGHGHLAGFAAGLLITGGLLSAINFRVGANGTEVTSFTGKSTAYNTYFGQSFNTNFGQTGCGVCHGADTTIANLTSYGTSFWNRMVSTYSSSRTTTNERNAMTDIESTDSDGDGYTNISEINANTNASSSASKPTAAVALSTGQNAKSGTPSSALSYSVTVTNNGNLTDSFTLGVSVFSGQTWTPSITGTANSVAAGGTASITVNLTVDAAATAGQTSVARVTATSQSNATISATALDLTTTALAPTNATRFVNAATGSDTGTCATSGSPCKTITYAMSQAVAGSPGDLVSVAPGTYNLALGEVFPIGLKSGIQLKATGSPSDTIIDGVGDTVKNSLLSSNGNASSAALIEGFTLKNGIYLATIGAVATGGGVRISNATATVTVKRNVFSDNLSRGLDGQSLNSNPTGGQGWAGALYITSSAALVTNNVFVSNTARGGDGFSNLGFAPNGNQNGGSGDGGALVFFGTGSVTNNTFYGNSATGGNGGSGIGQGNAGNASNGAANTGSGVTVANNIFSNNASAVGGGVTTFATATTGALTASVTPLNNLFFGNTINGAASTGDSTGTPSLTSDPLFISAPTNLRVANASPVKAAGTASGAPTTDFDSVTRPNPPAIGAFEPNPLPPTVTTSAATSVTATAATLNGTANPNSATTTAKYEYGTTLSYGTSTTVQSLSAGSSAVSIDGGAITGLTCGTTYNFRATATNSGGTTNGSNLTFTTSVCAPTVTTSAAVATATFVTFNGSANPNGATTSGFFEYGTTTAYGSTTTAQSLGSGSSATNLTGSAAVGGGAVTCGILYHFRAVATNSGGTSNGSDLTFTAPCPAGSPLITTMAATAITGTGATLNATVNPNGSSTAAYFEYGPTTAYGSKTTSQSLGSGTSAVALGGGGISGLTCGNLYHYRPTAKNTVADLPGADMTFTTTACPVVGSTLSINDAAADEGNSGTKTFEFTVTLSPASSGTVTVSYATFDGTATAGSDYTSTSSSLSFAAGETTKKINVTVAGDTTVESNEGFGVLLSGPALSTLKRAVGLGTIRNDDASSAVARPQPSWQEFFAVDTLETPYIGDFNGDGKVDIITFTRQNPAAIGDVYVSLSDGAKFGTNTKWHDFFAITTDESVVIGDYNGDGKDDIATWLGKASRQIYVALSTGTGMLSETVWVNSLGVDPTDLIFSGDTDGDGKDDLIAFARKEGKVYVALSDGTKFGTPTVWHNFFAVSTFERPRVADVNGDGKDDIVTFATDSPTAFGDVYVATSNGTQFVSLAGNANDSSKWHDFFAIRPTEEIRIGDLNGDGKDDFFTFLPPPFAQCYSVLSQGTSMAENALWAEAVAPLLGVGDNVYVGDVNGDLKADIIIFAQKEGKVFVSIAP